MKKENKVYIIGHKNPDTDSICSAIAYADIKNRTSKGKYIPKRAGAINDETAFVLDYFNISVPGYIPDVRSQIKDMEFRETPGVEKSMSVKRAWNLMQQYGAGTLPIVDNEGVLEGLMTHGDIAKSYMDAYDNTFLAQAKPRYCDIADTIDGTVIVGNHEDSFKSGKVWSGTSQTDILENMISENDLVIVGNRTDAQLCAIDAGVNCMIVCMDSKISKSIKKLAEEKKVVIILTPFDAFSVARLIYQSIPVEYFMKKALSFAVIFLIITLLYQFIIVLLENGHEVSYEIIASKREFFIEEFNSWDERLDLKKICYYVEQVYNEDEYNVFYYAGPIRKQLEVVNEVTGFEPDNKMLIMI